MAHPLNSASTPARPAMAEAGGAPGSGRGGGVVAGTGRWAGVSGMAGIVISVAVHFVLLGVAALVVLASSSDDGRTAGAPVQFAVLTESELAEIAGGSLDADAPEVPDAPPSELPEIDITLPDAIGLEAIRESLQSVGGGTGAGDISTGSGLGGAGGGAGVAFFGVEATGSRFAYIIDVSGSMAIGGRMDAMRAELLRSVSSLLENHSFMVVPFSSDAAPLGGRNGWIDATDRGKSWARRAVMELIPNGGTNPSPGFFYVFSQRPRPDAIYFLTDGEFAPSVAAEIEGLNASHDVPIHCIAFGTREPEAVMRRIAQRSGGTYTYIAIGGIP